MRSPRKNTRRRGGAEIDQVESLHKLAVQALIQQIRTEMEQGEVKAATITAALKICDSSGVVATLQENQELSDLNDLISKLELDVPVY